MSGASKVGLRASSYCRWVGTEGASWAFRWVRSSSLGFACFFGVSCLDLKLLVLRCFALGECACGLPFKGGLFSLRSFLWFVEGTPVARFEVFTLGTGPTGVLWALLILNI